MTMDIEKIISQMTLEEKAGFCTGQDFWHTKAVERLGVPAVMMCDGPNGLRKQDQEGDHLGINDSISTVCYPTASAVAASFDTELAHRLGETLGEECQREKITMLLGPGVNMKRSPLCGRNFEYYSEDPYVAGKMAAGYIKGLQSRHVSACMKHFAANNQETMRMSGNSTVDERTLHEIYLAAFETAVKEAAPRSVMCAYNRLNGVFCSENKHLLTEVLRDKWGFDGFVVTDWGAGKDGAKGVEAGLDLVMPGDAQEASKSILAAVKSGELAESRLDQAVRRILTVMKWNLENQPEKLPESDESTRRADYETAREMAKECAVLLKNDNGVLPLKKEAKVAFIGAFAEKPRYQGSGSSHINSVSVPGALEAAKGLNVVYARGYDPGSDRTDSVLLEEALEAAKAADAAVIFAGLTDVYESEGFDRRTLDMPQNQNELIAAVAAVQPNTAVVLHNGAPVTMPWLQQVPAVLEMYLAGDGAGEAAVSLLYGDANPSGKLAETFPKKLSDTPCYLNFPGEEGSPDYREGVFIGYRYYDKKEMEVLFPFGHGLSYTTFAYSDLKLDKASMKDDEQLAVTVTVTNTGKVYGKEAVQLYVEDVESTPARPLRELKGFAKVALAPGEKKEVTFLLDWRAFAYYEVKLHDFFVESGEFIVSVGASSRDIRLSASVTVEGTREIPRVFTAHSTIGEVMKTEKGRQFIRQMKENRRGHAAQAKESDVNALGEGSAVMAETMMKEMPLSGLITFAGLTAQGLEEILKKLNE